MNIQRINDKIVFVKFKNRDQMAKTVLRIGEYYDTKIQTPNTPRPTFRQYIKWYKQHEGQHPYKNYFQGLTLPDVYIRHFIHDYKPKEYIGKEKEFIDGLASVLGKKNLKRKIKFSVIMCAQGMTSSVFKHELSHAMIYMDRVYAHKVLMAIRKIDKKERKKLKQYLIRTMGYERHEVSDEIACRLLERMSLKSLFYGVKVKIPNKIREELRMLLNKHSPIAKNN
jgi:hypothetical protein